MKSFVPALLLALGPSFLTSCSGENEAGAPAPGIDEAGDGAGVGVTTPVAPTSVEMTSPVVNGNPSDGSAQDDITGVTPPPLVTADGTGVTGTESPPNAPSPGVDEAPPGETPVDLPDAPDGETDVVGSPNEGADNGEPASDTNAAVPEPDEPAPVVPVPTEPGVPVPAEPVAPLDDADCAVPEASANPIGYGEGTTGGGNATPVLVSTFAEAEAALADYRSAFKGGEQTSLVIRYTGRFDYSSITDVCVQHTLESQVLQIKEMENVTFEGASGSSANFGIKINRAKNVIVRNMTMGLLPGGGDSDAITLEGNGTSGDVEHVWIDHNELFSSTKDDCDGAGDTEFDGLIDIKSGARYITVSYNFLHDHQKVGLIGHSDSEMSDRYVTFHHNWYENVVSRTPLHRYGYIHLFNNYYDHILDSGINVRMNGVALIEANFFENAQNPVTSRYSPEAGSWELRDNYLGAGITWSTSDDTLANAESWESTTTFPANELTYSYVPNEARCVKKVVTAHAGANLAL